jgi:DamX protein
MTAYADTQYGSKVIANDRSNYWRYYGLHRDPFMPIVEDTNFFLPARWEQYFDLLHYLCESTNVLLNVVGAKGSGKTTFMRQFVAQASDNAQVCRLVGSAVLTAAQLSKTLIKDFNLPKPTGETTEEQWESLCLSLQAGAQPYLLVIDDGHRLPQETLKIILNLIKQQSEHQMRLHILLIGEMQLMGLLNALKEGDADRELIHHITLEPFSPLDTEAYIKHRLVAAGLPGGMPLRVTDIARIHKLSEGVPGRINAVARQVLIDVMQQRQLYSFAHFIRARRTQFLGGTVIFIGLLALAFILTRGSHDPALQLYNLLVSEKTDPAPINRNETNATVPATQQKAVVMPTAVINNAELSTGPVKTIGANKAANTNTWYETSMVEFKAKSSDPKKLTAQTVENSPVQTTVIEPAKPITTVKTVKTAAAIIQPAQTKKAPISNKLLALDSPLLSNPNHYTLQLIGVSSEAAVSQFINKYQLNEQAYYYNTKLRNKNWYVVVFGDYTTRQEAQNALNTLPVPVRDLQPWSRTMADVQVSIRHGLSAQTNAAPQATAMEQQATSKPIAKPINQVYISKY